MKNKANNWLHFFLALIILALLAGAILGPAFFGRAPFIKDVDFPNKHEFTPFEDISLKTKELTPKDSLIIIPPFQESFRTYSERSIYFGWMESGTFLHFPSYAEESFKKLIDLCGPFDENLTSSRLMESICKTNLKNINIQKLNHLKEKYGATHFISEKPINLKLNILYENKDYILYEIGDKNDTNNTV